MLSIWPILSAAPRTLQSVLTILSALASDRKAESNNAFPSANRSDVPKCVKTLSCKGSNSSRGVYSEHMRPGDTDGLRNFTSFLFAS